MKRLCNALLGSAVVGAFLLHFPAAQTVFAREKVLYSFCSQSNCTDGANPEAALIHVNGTLYGTTTEGGKHASGTVFSLDPRTGAEKVLYSFAGGTDGASPIAALIEVNGTMYGTTRAGGTAGDGTVFSIDPSTGAEKVLHTFGGADGRSPYAGLVNVNGKLYGTTYYGGSNDWGTVFSVDINTGKEKVLYSFVTGIYPYAGVIEMNGLLYGTTTTGGSKGFGDAYSLDPKSGTETVVHDFCSYCADGGYPQATLIDVNGILYGTTLYGGVGSCVGHRLRCGTLFSLDPRTGAESVLYSFCGQSKCADGLFPYAGLIDVNGMLFGTTSGKPVYAHNDRPAGNVFSFDPDTGTETVLYSFCRRSNCTDGRTPEASLVKLNDKLYGTTAYGGANGDGEVFSLPIP